MDELTKQVLEAFATVHQDDRPEVAALLRRIAEWDGPSARSGTPPREDALLNQLAAALNQDELARLCIELGAAAIVLSVTAEPEAAAQLGAISVSMREYLRKPPRGDAFN